MAGQLREGFVLDDGNVAAGAGPLVRRSKGGDGRVTYSWDGQASDAWTVNAQRLQPPNFCSTGPPDRMNVTERKALPRFPFLL
jgi:hypothetical protein